MARAPTTQELVYLRGEGQFTQLGLAIYNPQPVLTARVGTPPDSLDSVREISIGSLVGSSVDVQDGMTVWIGSAAGGSDIGVVSAIKATSTVLTIGRTSELALTAGQYVSVFPDWQIWSRQLQFNGGVWNIEGDTPYTDQNDLMDPVPVLGPTAAVKRLTGATVTLSPDASGSWAPNGTITAYTWSAPGGSVSAGQGTATPTITYSSVGQYHLYCTVSCSNGKTAIGHRYVFIIDDTGSGISTQFSVKSLAGDLSEGGWTFDVTMYSGSDYSAVRDRAFVVLFARDWYDGTEISLGPIPGYENVVCAGWIEGETITQSPEQGSVQFKVSGPASWMAKVSSWPISVMDTTGVPIDWMHITDLTIDKALWHLTHWRSTVDRIIDVIPSGDTRRAFDCSANGGTLWDQLKAFCDAKIVATPGSDRYCRLVVQVDPQVIPVASRSGIPVALQIAKNDWSGTIDIPLKLPTTALLESGGFCYLSGQWTAMLARASGNAMSRLGSGLASRYNLEFEDQASANILTAAIFAKMNNLYPSVSVDLAQNNRMIDIVPVQYVTLTIASGDTPRGMVWTNKRMIPRHVEFNYENGLMTTNIESEVETVPGQSVTVPLPMDLVENTIPVSIPKKFTPFNSPYPNNHPTVLPRTGPNIPPGVCTDTPNGPFYASANGTITNARKQSIYVMFGDGSATARPSSFSNKSVLILQCSFQNLTAGIWVTDPAGSFAEAYLLDERSARLAQGTWSGTGSQRTITFAPPSGTRFYGVEICLDAYSSFNVTDVTTSFDSGTGAFASVDTTGSTSSWSVGVDGALYLAIEMFGVGGGGLGGYTTFIRSESIITAPGILGQLRTEYDVYGKMTLFASDDTAFAAYHAFQSWRTGIVTNSEPVGEWKNYLGLPVTIMNGPLDPSTQSPAYREIANPRDGDLLINFPKPYAVWMYGAGLRVNSQLWYPAPIGINWHYLLNYIIYGQAQKRLVIDSGIYYNLCP